MPEHLDQGGDVVMNAPGGNTVIFEGSKGTIHPDDGIVLKENQTVLGAGSRKKK